MTETIWVFLQGLSEIWYPVFQGLIALVETIFPPFPGDVIYIALSGLGWNAHIHPVLLWIPGFAGCFISTIILDSVGRSPGLQKLEKLILGKSDGKGMNRAKTILAGHGPWVLVVSRFVPGIRSILVVAAASSGMKRPVVLIWAGLSAGLWYALLTGAGYFAGAGLKNAEEMMSGLTSFLILAMATLLLAGITVMLFRLKRT
jgi:membrane protein DedA with SNARE-associated domain